MQVSAGKIGALPSSNAQQLTATVRAQSRLQTPDQFKAIIVKSQADGSVVRLSDVARVEMGSEDYTATANLNGHPAAGIAVMMAPGANALDTATLVKSKIAEFQRQMPQGYDIAYPKDSTEFIKISVEDVIQTLFEAIILVVVRDVPVPAKHPCDADPGAGGAGGAAGHLRRAGAVRLLHQHPDAICDGAGDRAVGG
ncbi:efflux RND transporter permease subunit [Klebsiella pneumoniae]